MAKRYSGDVVFEIRYHDARAPAHPKGSMRGHYTVSISAHGRRIHTVTYGEPAHLTKAVDSPEMYDDVAESAALGLLHDHEETGGHLHLNRNGHPLISRSK
jgi:hypothetical protein